MPDAIRPIDPEELLSQVGSLRALARRLLADEARADDVVQQALLAAIERPPRSDVAPGPWLVGVVRNLVRRTHRAEGRRCRHETAASPGTAPAGPDQIAARSEALRDLAAAVHRLDPVCRDVVILHYFDGLSVREVAARLGAPVETVRSRLERALAQLRERLDAEHGGDDSRWRGALAPLLAGGGAVSRVSLVQGGIAMTTPVRALIAAVVVLVLAVTIAVSGSGTRDGTRDVAAAGPPMPTPAPSLADRPETLPAPASDALQPPAAAPPPAVAPRAEDPVAPPAEPPPAVVTEPVGTGAVFGAVHFAATRRPAAGQEVILEAAGSKSLRATADARGNFRFDRVAEHRPWCLRVEAKGLAPVVVPNVWLERDESRALGVLWLDAVTPFGVVVKDWRDQPISGATVEASRPEFVGISDMWSASASSRHVSAPVAAAVTGIDGRAVLGTLPPGEWDLVARAPGFAPARSQRSRTVAGEAARDVTIRLDRGLAVRGRVVDGDRHAVRGLAVWAEPRDAGGTRAVASQTTTDDSGGFEIDGVLPGDWSIRVARERSSPSEVARVRVPAPDPIEIVLDGGVVEGVVTGRPDGTPLEGARVRALVGLRIVETLTGPDGRYRLDTLLAGRPSWFRVERHGFLPLSATTPNRMSNPELRGASDTMQRDFELERGVPLAGRVVCPDGPVVGASVIATWADREENWTPLLRVEGRTDGDGRFALAGVPPTTVVVQAFAEGWYQEGLADFNWSTALARGAAVDGAIDVPPGGLTDVSITMSRACAVSGRVESAAGTPVAGAAVRCVWSTTTTRDDGTFALDAAVIGPGATISASAGPGVWTQQPITLSRAGRVAGVVLRLPPIARIGGRVTDTAGVAVAGALLEVVFQPLRGEQGMTERTIVRVPVGGDGRYVAEFPVAEGRVLVRASAPGFASSESPPMTVETGRVTYTANVTLAASRTIEGRVVSAIDGWTPVEGARIALVPRDRQSRPYDPWQRTQAAVTDRGGRFRILDAAAGDTLVGVAAAGYVTAVVPAVAPAGRELVLRLEPSLEIAGMVTLPDGAVASDTWDGGEISGVSVLLRLEHDPDFMRSWSVCTGADGRFRVSGLPRGTYTVSVDVRGGTISVAPFETRGIAAGTTDLAIRLLAAKSIAGRVFAPDGRPLGGCSVVAYSETGLRFTPWAMTKDDGSFAVRGFGEGTYRLEVEPPEAARTGYVTQGAYLRPARATGVRSGAVDVEIRLTGGATIRGVVLDPKGAPLANVWIRAEARRGQDLGPGEDVWFLAPGGQSDAAGRFTISGLATARYRLVHVPDPQRIDVVRPLKGGEDVAAGATGVRLVAGGASRVSGVVIDDSGRGVARATVTATPGGDGPAVSVQTQADGTFVLDGVSDLAPCIVRVEHTDFLSGRVDGVAPGTTGLRVQLDRGLRATGRILEPDGRPFARAVVTLTLEGGEHRVTMAADEGGRFVASGLRAGVYRVEVRPAVSSGASDAPRPAGTIRGGDADVEVRIAR